MQGQELHNAHVTHFDIRRRPSKSDGKPALCFDAKRMFGRSDSSVLSSFGLPGPENRFDARAIPDGDERGGEDVPETVADVLLLLSCPIAVVVDNLRSSCRSGHTPPFGQYPLVNGSQTSAVALTFTWRYLQSSRVQAPRRNILQSGTLFCTLTQRQTHHNRLHTSSTSRQATMRAKHNLANFSTSSCWCDSKHLGSLHSFFKNFRHIATRRLS